ncbi:MAG: hypothetical protein ACPGJE_06595 [Wenzhouxiangellaceae bacterium]
MSRLRARIQKWARRWLERLVPAGAVWWSGIQYLLDLSVRSGAG